MNKYTGQTKTIKNYWLKSTKRAKRDFSSGSLSYENKGTKRNKINERNLKKRKKKAIGIVVLWLGCAHTLSW